MKRPRPCHSEGRIRPRNLLFLFSVLSLLLLLVTVFSPSSAARDLRLKKFFAEIVVLPNGTVDITENITFEFIGGPWHGINRYIPVEYSGPRGLNYSLFLDVQGITDESGSQAPITNPAASATTST